MTKELFLEYLEKGYFVPFYQPKVNLRTNEIMGAEALVRLIVDDKFINPDDFIPFLEKENLTYLLDLCILEKVCKDIKLLEEKGKIIPKISVNFSRKDLEQVNLTEKIKDIIFTNNVDVKYLEMEVTESASENSEDVITNFIKDMHENNIKVSIDDFGSGYTSLRMLTSTNFDTVKLDKFLIDFILENPNKSKILIKNFMNVCNELGMEVIAEGVEDDKQISLLNEVNCCNIQGFYYFKPLPVNEFGKKLLSL